MTETIGKTKETVRNWVAGGVMAIVIGVAVVGVPAVVNASNTAHAQEIAQTDAANGATAVTRADGARDILLVGSATQAGVIAQQEADAKAAAAAAAQAAAAQAAAQAAADAAAAQAAQQQQAQQQQQQSVTQSSNTQTSNTGSSSSSGEPSGTPLPMAQVTDPNNGQYGQMVPTVDPASWCANHSASTINGVPTCD